MKNSLKASLGLGILFVAFALNSSGESESGTSSSEAGTPDHSDAQKKSGIATYLPNLPFSVRKQFGDQNMRRKLSPLKNISSGKRFGSIGVSKAEDEMPAMGPGAFVFLKNKKTFAVLDSQNGRLNFYPIDGNGKITSIAFPTDRESGPNRQGLGLAVDDHGKVILLSRQYDVKTGAVYPFYEVWHLDENASSDPWGVNQHAQQNFSFANHKTHGAAQSLEMQVQGDRLIFKGLGENEFHTLGPQQKQTQQVQGFPTSTGSTISLAPAKVGENKFIQIRDSRNESPVQTSEDMDRLASYRVLPSGLVALTLDVDATQQIPREVVIVNPKDGQVKARTELKPKDDVDVDQDIFYQDNNVFQLSAHKAGAAPANFEITQSEFAE